MAQPGAWLISRGRRELSKGSNDTFFYYQDKLGSTTHVANASGALIESYRYDLWGTPSYFNSTSQSINSSTYGIVDLYAGERWIPDLGLYDLRNRFMSSELGRFLQADPIGFKGDGSNLYRYCGNDTVNKSDPMGLENPPPRIMPDRMWESAKYWDTGNSFQGSFNEWMERFRPQAGMGDNAGGGPKGVWSENEGPKRASNPGARNQPGKPDFAIRSIRRAYATKKGDTYYAHVFWRIQLFHHKDQKPLGRGIQFRELIQWSEAVDFKAKEYIRGEQPTRDDGSVDDPWKLPFSSPDGQVKTTQTILAGGREATWDATVHANGTVEAKQYTEFTEPTH